MLWLFGDVPKEVEQTIVDALDKIDNSRAGIDALSKVLDAVGKHTGQAKLHEFAARLRGTEGDAEHADLIMEEFERWCEAQQEARTA